MEGIESVLNKRERITLSLRALYVRSGYAPYRMSKFEEYDLYAGNKDFLVSDRVITFTDMNGKLMALKPDVTLSIIKNSPDEPEKTRRVCYDENVYRVSKGADGYREIPQAGVECFGRIGEDEAFEVLSLAVKSLRLFSKDGVLALSDLTLLENAVASLGLPADDEKKLYRAAEEKNLEEIARIAGPESLLETLLKLGGGIEEALAVLKGISQKTDGFLRMLERIANSELKDAVRLDFSVIADTSYYGGIVFKGYVKGLPEAVLSGGQYDRLMRRLKRSSGAVGFAVYLDALERLGAENAAAPAETWLNVALPKGRLGEQVYRRFAAAGYECPSILEENRKLIFENAEKKLRYFWVKPSDVAIYVERGAADVGVVGKDILLEYAPDVYELMDLKLGQCRMCVAGPKGFQDDPSETIRVATKFPAIARAFYQSEGRDIDVIKLNGSIELAPILGLSDVIVDIVETGTTLRENDLSVIQEIVPISARLIANKAAAKYKGEMIEALTQGLQGNEER